MNEYSQKGESLKMGSAALLQSPAKADNADDDHRERRRETWPKGSQDSGARNE